MEINQSHRGKVKMHIVRHQILRVKFKVIKSFIKKKHKSNMQTKNFLFSIKKK